MAENKNIYPKRTMKERYNFHSNRGYQSIKKGEKLSDRDLKMISVGYVRASKANARVFHLKNGTLPSKNK